MKAFVLFEKSAHGDSCPFFSVEINALDWATSTSTVIMPCDWDCSILFLYCFLTVQKHL